MIDWNKADREAMVAEIESLKAVLKDCLPFFQDDYMREKIEGAIAEKEPVDFKRVEPEEMVRRMIDRILEGPKHARASDEGLRRAAKVLAMGLNPEMRIEGPKGQMFLTKRGAEAIFEAVMGGGYIDLRDYVAVRSDNSRCGDCNSKVVLLSRLEPDNGPEFYVCHCGMLALVGHGVLRHGNLVGGGTDGQRTESQG